VEKFVELSRAGGAVLGIILGGVFFLSQCCLCAINHRDRAMSRMTSSRRRRHECFIAL
jgi:hypothetical protein